MAILLWIGGVVAFFADMPELGVAIWLVNIINGVFSFMQEYRAGKATEALKKMLPSYARVLRDGKEAQILAEELVPGDIMLIEEGDKISADARLIFSSDFQVNQSTLTGESNPVRKSHEPVLREGLSRFEIPDLIFAGTGAASGTARAAVVSTGMQTEFGKIANLTQTLKEEKSPLEKRARDADQTGIHNSCQHRSAVLCGCRVFCKAILCAGFHIFARYDSSVHSRRTFADSYTVARHGGSAYGKGARAC
jgi:magnesium-transporting ATPase (P-type)